MNYQDPDECIKKMEEILPEIKSYSEKILTETDTRVKIIDLILKEALGWKEENIIREESIKEEKGTKYIDYIFESNMNKFIVEAKKNDIYFDLPICRNKLHFNGIIAKNKPTASALEQAINYCQKKKVEIGVISNGSQFIVFNILDKKNQVYVFKDIEEIIDKFNIFFNIFSPYSNSNMGLERILGMTEIQAREMPQYSKKINVEKIYSDEKINRNPIDKYVQEIIESYISDLNYDANSEVADELYCTDKNITNYESVINNLLRDDIPKMDILIQDSSNFHNDFLQIQSNNIKKIERPAQTLLLVGGVGARKNYIYKEIL